MLKLPQNIQMIKSQCCFACYLNQNILGFLKGVVVNYEDIFEKEAQEDDPYLPAQMVKLFKVLLCYTHDPAGLL